MAKSKDNKPKSVFDLSEKEEETRLQGTMDRLKKEIYANGLPIIYQDERCPSEDHYIEAYEDGRIHLVLFDIPTRKYIFVKDLTNA